MFLTTKSVPAWEDKLDTTRSTKLVADISLMMIAWGALWCLQSSTTRARLHVSTDSAKSQDSEAIGQTMQVVIKPKWYGPGPRDIQDEVRINPVYPESTRSLPCLCGTGSSMHRCSAAHRIHRTRVSDSAQRGRAEANRWPRSSTQQVLPLPQLPQVLQHAAGYQVIEMCEIRQG